MCVCVCVCVYIVFCACMSLLCDGLCAPVWRNSTKKGTLLLLLLLVICERIDQLLLIF